MEEEKSLSLIDAKAIGKKIFDGWAYLLLGMVVLLSVLYEYTEAEFNLFVTMRMGLDYAVLLASCYAGMFSLDTIAKKRGEEDVRYLAAIERLEEVRRRVKAHDGADVQEFCEKYREEELRATVRQILSEAMLSESDLVEYRSRKKLDGLSSLQKRALRRADRCKPIKLTRYMIGRPIAAAKGRVTFTTPEQDITANTMTTAFATALSLLFPVSFAVHVAISPTIATLVSGLLKLFAIALSGVRSYNTRLKTMVDTVPAYVRTQEDLVDQLDAWAKKRKEAE